MKKLYLMRHGETLFNVRHKIQGWCDSPLTKAGQQQALQVGKYFTKNQITFTHAYCSTSERCADTLELVTDRPYTRVKGLKEMNYGEFEGESEALRPKTTEAFKTFFLPYGGESSDAVKERMLTTLTTIMEQEDHECVLAVSHSGACYNFLRAIQDPSEELQKGFPNCCVFVYAYENQQFSLLEVIRELS